MFIHFRLILRTTNNILSDDHSIMTNSAENNVSELTSKGSLPPKHQSGQPQGLTKKVLSIRTKLTVLSLVLIAFLTLGSSIIMIQSMDQILFEALVDRGQSLANNTATSAAYSILARDQLALDNLAAKISSSQNDIRYLAILDLDGNILAHTQLEETGSRFIQSETQPVVREQDFTMYKVERGGYSTFEFATEATFANKPVGTVVIGIDSSTLLTEKTSARNTIAIISLAVMILGAFATFFLSRMVTSPIERLAEGVSQITSGNYNVDIKSNSMDELGDLTRSFNQMSQVIHSQRKRLEDYADNLEEAYISTVRILAAALDARDNYTLGHSERVAFISILIGKRLGLDKMELKELEMACFLHDIGKIHVSDQILNKPIPLDLEEYQIIKKHPIQGADVLSLAESLHKYIPVVLHHHEWFNGQGYPHGLEGDEIDLFAQIVAIADSYDAMTSSRPYRKGSTREQAMAEIIRFSGLQFNPKLVDIFIEILNKFEDDEALFSSGGLYANQKNLFTNIAVSSYGSKRLHQSPEQGQALQLQGRNAFKGSPKIH
ncbi:MAG: HD domain-containing protein [Deltaproteobacteria bacterium]|nr:HD domain-containing protein [Deltaproteobacteria bacterium]